MGFLGIPQAIMACVTQFRKQLRFSSHSMKLANEGNDMHFFVDFGFRKLERKKVYFLKVVISEGCTL